MRRQSMEAYCNDMKQDVIINHQPQLSQNEAKIQESKVLGEVRNDTESTK